MSGRPPKALDTELVERLVVLLRSGTTVEVACDAAGIDRATYYRWMAAGRAARPAKVYRDFHERVERAKAESEARAVSQIAHAGQEDWRAAAWLLERRHPDRWGRPADRVQVIEAPPAVIPDDPDPFAEIDELAEKRRQAGR